MSWTLLIGLVLLLSLSLFATLSRRAELQRMARTVAERERAVRQGSAESQLQHPVVDLSRCLGCATCVAVCPEEGVLDVLHGQAVVINGARCVGHALCERACPVGAITVTLTNLEERRDIPVVDDQLEAVGSPGLFLAGEVTAHTLIRTAIAHGTAVADEVARRVAENGKTAPDGTTTAPVQVDLCIVGAGPAGLACALQAKALGLGCVLLEQEAAIGGTVAKYPRRKLVLMEPVELPLHGMLQREYTKEELIELWHSVVEQHELQVLTGEVFERVERRGEQFLVHTRNGVHSARFVCLALGRRGVPNTLGVPGEDLPKVAYSLLDSSSYQGRRILVVGGGDSAVEAALGLSEQPGTRVTLSYRKESFFRIRTRNQQRLEQARAARKLEVLLQSEVQAIHADKVELRTPEGVVARANDDVFVMAGGTTPIELLTRSGVSFDPALRPPSVPITEQGTGLMRALAWALGFAVLALLWALWHLDYYRLPAPVRPTHDKHGFLRPSLGIGLWLGVAATALIGANLLYLVRRSLWFGLRLGSLTTWMTSHVATGILAFLLVLLHGGLAPRDTPGGHAFWALLILLVTGAVGRYFYSYVPRAANGRELELAEVKDRLARVPDSWSPGQREFGQQVRKEILGLIEARQWRSTFFGRVLALLGVQRGVRRTLQRLGEAAREAGIPEEQIHHTLGLARDAHRTALTAAHFEDLRAILGTWRWLHRWVAVFMVVLVVIHVVHALAFGALLQRGPG
jgi:thioredoxin reductase